MWRFAFIFLGLLSPLAVPHLFGSEALALERRLTTVFRDNNAKVVRIKAAYESETENGKVSLRVGTGFFVSSDGLILANSSVTEGARRIWVEQGDTSYVAEMVGSDAETNIALLQVTDQPKGSFDFIPVDEQPYPDVGTLLLSIGCALEFDPAPRLGLVSGQDSNFGQRVFPTAYIRTTIPANPGEGGSPVLDLNGRLLGMIVASLPEVGASYVIPASAIGRVRDDLMLNGSVQYGWIGVEVESRPRGADDEAPLLVTSVVPGGPSDVAGIQEGDRIQKINGLSVPTINVMRHRFFLARIGQYIDFMIEREDKVLDLGVRVGERPAAE
ncbi:S1C family serine protease [Puniceicoccus vermicola]|uniref:S1C family serine protease n=1 Tax=Puniceicoccus vermicola TaxID=388746 RepID=UPI00163957CF|nr:trypsin-like peptidase domain-containing protein [Puniceicoccus vermicola]